MTYSTWGEAVAALSPLLRKCTEVQRALADSVGITLPKSVPWLVAGARLQVALAEHLGVDAGQLPTDSQEWVIGELAGELQHRLPLAATRLEADAWIRYLYLTKRLRALKELRPMTGDVVRRVVDPPDEVREISSIGTDGRLYFRGGRSQAWPDRVNKLAEAADRSPSADGARRSARNLAADEDRDREWSVAKMKALGAYEVPDDPAWYELDELRDVIDSAPNEEPIQAFLQDRPHILGALVRGPIRYTIPKAPLGISYVTDFLVADVDSIGIRWVLIELETPRSAIAQKNKNDFDKYARQGLTQIREWREWLKDNLANAHQLRESGGLGLFDIRPQADGLVIVGRRDRLAPRAKRIRAQVHESERIQVHTYDWLLQQLQGVLNHNGPPATNPYLLPRPASLEPDPWFTE